MKDKEERELVDNIGETLEEAIEGGMVDANRLVYMFIDHMEKQDIYDMLDAEEYFYITRPEYYKEQEE